MSCNVKGLMLAGLAGLMGACSAPVGGADQAAEVDAVEAALVEDDGALHPDCADYRYQCFENDHKDKLKHCKKYSERCEVSIGVLGDSLSDEYQGFVNLPALTWTEQVQDDPRITMGAAENDASVRGEPRNDGFDYNWARYAQAALDTQWNSPEVVAALGGYQDFRWPDLGPFQVQIDGLSAQIAAGDVDVAVIWVGHNDLFLRNVLGLPVDAPFVGALVTRIVTAALQLQAAGDAKVAILGLAGTPSDIGPLNAALAGAAAGAGITFINPFEAVITALTAGPTYTVGGTVLTPFFPDTAAYTDLTPSGTGPCAYDPQQGVICSTPAYANSYRNYDGVHPNTVYMGLVGNQIVRDLNAAFGFNMRTTPDAQLLTNAGL